MQLPGIFSIPESWRFYPESGIGGQVLGFVGADDQGHFSGRYGIEGYFDTLLAGVGGFLRSERDLSGSFIATGEQSMEKAIDGANLVLTIDRNIQFVTCQKLQKAVARHGAQSGSVIIIEPKTGNILAMCAVPDFDPNQYEKTPSISFFNNPLIFSAYEPGSIFKPITMAAALDQGVVSPETTFEDTGSVIINNTAIHNSENKVYGIQTMTQVLEESINTGIIFAMQKVGHDLFSKYVHSFGFGTLSGIELKTEMPGDISSLEKTSDIYAATASFGQGITATALQLAISYATIANGGVRLMPQIISEIDYPDGSKQKTLFKQGERVISEKTARLVAAMLVSVVENGHGKRAAVKGYYVAGKTGTAQVPKADGSGYEEKKTIGSFVGFAPVNDPRFAMLVRIDDPKDVLFAESSAAPLFGEIADFLLNYLEVPPERAFP
jgi:cell division protein FtsI/penicillin-binding protein 2